MISQVRTSSEGYVSKLQSILPSGGQLLRNINKIALPAIALAALGLIQGANAGPIAYAACVTLCCGTFLPLIPVLLPACASGCAPVLLLPTP